MERRNAQVFEVETTDLDESIDLSAPTVVVSAAPLQPCVRASAPTVRHVAPGRLPGRPLRTQAPPPPRRAQEWAIELAWETSRVGSIPLPGERACNAVTMVLDRAVERPSAQALTILQQAPSVQAATIMQRAPLAMRACEPPVQYSVEREVSAMAAPRKSPSQQCRRSGHILVLIIGMLAGFMTVLTVVVVRQQRELRMSAEPAHRANEACAAYAAEVGAVARELTQAAGDVADVEMRIGERARSVVNDRGLQSVCIGRVGPRCAGGDPTCVAAAVMELRQALARR